MDLEGGEMDALDGNQVVEQPRELPASEMDAIQSLELLAKVGLKGGAVANVGPISVFEVAQLGDEGRLNIVLADGRGERFHALLVGIVGRHEGRDSPDTEESWPSRGKLPGGLCEANVNLKLDAKHLVAMAHA